MRKSILTLSVAAALAVPGLAPRKPPAAAPPRRTRHRQHGDRQRLPVPRHLADLRRSRRIQGGFDYAHSSGFYVGNWNSNVSERRFPGGSASRWTSTAAGRSRFGDFGLDVGTIYYYYPQRRVPRSAGQRRQRQDRQQGDLHRRQLEVALGEVLLRDQRLLRPARRAGDSAATGSTATLARARLDPDRAAWYFDLTATFRSPRSSIVAHYGMLKSTSTASSTTPTGSSASPMT